MKAVVCERYGEPEVLKVKEVDKPVPKDEEVLIKVHTSSVTRYDCWARSCSAKTGLGLIMRLWFGFRKPKQPILGTELSGVVVKIGKKVSRLKVGDEVFGYTGMNMGAYAEYACVPEKTIVKKPQNLSFEEAGTVIQGALTSYYFLRLADIKKGEKVLILGASGGVGMYATQIAKKLHGAEVTGVCSSSKMEFVKDLGADHVIDYNERDFSKEPKLYDVIFDTFGLSGFSTGGSLKKDGRFLLATYGLPQLINMGWIKLTSKKQVISPLLEENTEDLLQIKDLLENGTIRSVMDRTYDMNEVSKAHEHLETGRKRGNIGVRFSA